MKYLSNWLIYSVLIFLRSGLVYADCNDVNKSNFENILKRATTHALPAVGLYYQKNDCIIQLADGYSNLATKNKIQTTDRFDIGSVTKTFVAVTSVKLAKAGVFKLDDNIQQWLPQEITSRIPGSNFITIRHLLSHTSGIADYLDGDFFGLLFTNLRSPLSEHEALQFVFDKPLFFEPGTGFQYSNTNYLLMGLIINTATGKHFSTIVRELIIEPLDLMDTFHISESNHYLEYVHGYFDLGGSGILQDGYNMAKLTPFAEGEMVSSLQDLATFIQAIFTDKNFMDVVLLETLLSSPLKASNYGLGIGIGTSIGFGQIKSGVGIESNKIAYGHGGSEYGYETFFQYSPGINETTIIFATGGDGIMTTFGTAYTSELKRELLKEEWRTSL